LPDVYDCTREEKENGGVKDWGKESGNKVNVPLLKSHKVNLSLASSKAAGDRVRAAAVLRQPFFA
jgi:hypothetical protein